MASWRERRQQWVESREEAANNASQAAAESGQSRPTTPWPFLIAVGIVAAILAAIFIAARFAPAGDNVTQTQLMTDSVEDFVTAQNTGDAELLRASTCAAQVSEIVTGSDEDYRKSRADAVAEVGETKIDAAPTGYQINGDRGVVTVPTKEEKSGVTTNDEWTLVLLDDKWLVCNV